MKAILLTGLSAIVLTTAAAKAQPVLTVSPEFNSLSYPHLAELDQSQTVETLSMADGFYRLPASSYKTAGVYFITANKGQRFGTANQNNSFSDDTDATCSRLGFTVKSCPSGLFNKSCPYNDKIYDKCCDAGYKYNLSQCSAPKKPSSDTCGGKYKCYCDTRTYPYISCDSPKIKGSICSDDSGSHYSSCRCPTSASVPYGCQTYYAAPCNSSCKIAYSDNCRNRNAASIPYGCEKYFVDCASKCEKAYPDNCRNRNPVSSPYGCQKYYADCQAKCETAYSDNCRNRTAVTVPANASCSAYYSDCTNKCSSFVCKSGYTASGNSCKINQAPLPILYGDGTISKEVISGKSPIGIVFDETNRLAVSLTDVKKDGSAGVETMTWANNHFDVPKLTNCNYADSDTAVNSCSVDGHANTSAILNCGSSCGGTPAASAANNFQPAGCSKDFCKKAMWFLPSMRDWDNIYKLKDQLDASLTILSSAGATTFYKGLYYWSSIESDSNSAWDIYMRNGSRWHGGNKKGVCLVRPVIYYGGTNKN